jgi:TIR domain
MTTYEKFQLFVSYSCRDEEHAFIRELKRFFEKPEVKSIATCYMAEDVPDPGGDFVTKVIDALETSDAMLPFITKESQAAPWVNQEIGFARAKGIPILPAFDLPAGARLHGMIQTTEACRVDNRENVQALFRRVLALATQGPASRKRGLWIAVKGYWWSMHEGAFPMYVWLELTHKDKEPDAVESVFLECSNRTVEMESADRATLRELKAADHIEVVVKFFPNGSGQLERMRLVIQTVGEKKADAQFEASQSGYTPSDLWKDFIPY